MIFRYELDRQAYHARLDGMTPAQRLEHLAEQRALYAAGSAEARDRIQAFDSWVSRKNFQEDQRAAGKAPAPVAPVASAPVAPAASATDAEKRAEIEHLRMQIAALRSPAPPPVDHARLARERAAAAERDRLALEEAELERIDRETRKFAEQRNREERRAPAGR